MERMDIGSYSATIFRAERVESSPLIYLHAAGDIGTEIFNASARRCSFVCVSGFDWNRDMSPWPARRVFKNGEDFSGGAKFYLSELSSEIVPTVERKLGFEPHCRGIVGYSLAGLFALWSLYNSTLFSLAASVSGSLWFDGWLDYIKNSRLQQQPQRVYISLGDREKNSREVRMKTVEECSGTTAELLSAKFELNRGNHFQNIPQRIARALDYLAAEE